MMPAPNDAHRKLELMAGSWHGDEHLHPSPWDPHGGPAVGHVHNRMALDGFALIQDYVQERNDQPNFRGHAVVRFDGQANEYVMTWFDSFGGPPAEFRGRFEGDVLTLQARQAEGQLRARWDFSETGRYGYTMDVSGDGAQWMPFAEGVYKRQSVSPELEP